MIFRRVPWILLPPVGWLLAFLVIPVGVVSARALTSEGVAALTSVLTWKLVGMSVVVAMITTILCLVAGYPVAWCIATLPRRWRHFVLFLVVLPFWANLLVRTYALMTILRPFGLLDTWFAAVFGLWHSYLPFMVLPLYTSIEKVPVKLLEAAQDLGATPSQAFWRVAVPLTAPGIAAGCILVFIPVLGAFATPELLGGAQAIMAGSQINLYFMSARNPAAGAAMTLILMVITVVLMAAFYRSRRNERLL